MTSRFVNIFNQLEQDGLLIIDSDEDIYILHFVYLKAINLALNEFVSAWNSHKVRTTKLTPTRMFSPALFRGFQPIDDNIYFNLVHQANDVTLERILNSHNNVIVEVRNDCINEYELASINATFPQGNI